MGAFGIVRSRRPAFTRDVIYSVDQVGWIEVNVSCPNVHGGGMSFGTSASAAAEVTKAVKKVTTKPIIIKLSPNVTDIASIAKACEDEGAWKNKEGREG